jgi:hypothetical protein
MQHQQQLLLWLTRLVLLQRGQQQQWIRHQRSGCYHTLRPASTSLQLCPIFLPQQSLAMLLHRLLHNQLCSATKSKHTSLLVDGSSPQACHGVNRWMAGMNPSVNFIATDVQLID